MFYKFAFIFLSSIVFVYNAQASITQITSSTNNKCTEKVFKDYITNNRIASLDQFHTKVYQNKPYNLFETCLEEAGTIEGLNNILDSTTEIVDYITIKEDTPTLNYNGATISEASYPIGLMNIKNALRSTTYNFYWAIQPTSNTSANIGAAYDTISVTPDPWPENCTESSWGVYSTPQTESYSKIFHDIAKPLLDYIFPTYHNKEYYIWNKQYSNQVYSEKSRRTIRGSFWVNYGKMGNYRNELVYVKQDYIKAIEIFNSFYQNMQGPDCGGYDLLLISFKDKPGDFPKNPVIIKKEFVKAYK